MEWYIVRFEYRGGGFGVEVSVQASSRNEALRKGKERILPHLDDTAKGRWLVCKE